MAWSFPSRASSVLLTQYLRRLAVDLPAAMLAASFVRDSILAVLAFWAPVPSMKHPSTSFSRIGKDFSWSTENPISGRASAAKVQIGVISSNPSLRRTLSASSNTFEILLSGSISPTPESFSHSSMRISAHSSTYEESFPMEVMKAPSPTSLCSIAFSRCAGVYFALPYSRAKDLAMRMAVCSSLFKFKKSIFKFY